MACIDRPSEGSNCYLTTIERVHSYPIVNDSLLVALNCYQWAKSKNTTLDFTLSTLEGTLKTVKDKTEPLAAGKLQYVDETISNQLGRLERLCPILLQPSRAIAEIPANIYHERVEPSLHKVVKPMTQTLGLVSKTTCAVASMMSSTLTNVIPAGLLPIETTNNILNKTEQLLDRYLPEQDHSNRAQFQRHCDDDLFTTIKRLSKKTQHRIHRKVLRDIEHFKSVSVDKLTQIYSVIQEIKNSKDKVQDLKEKIRYDQLISDGLRYSDSLQQFVTTTAQAMPRFMCTHTISILDLINEKLFFVKNTIQESRNSKIMSEKRISQAAEVINLVRSWIEHWTDILKEYYDDKQEKESSEEHESRKEATEDHGSSSTESSSGNEEDEDNGT